MTETTPNRRWPWGKILLFVSLAFNLLIVGLIAGAMLGGPRGSDRNPLLRDLGYGPFISALPREDKIAITKAMREKGGSIRETRAELRRQFQAFLTALRTEPFDRAEVERLITDQRSRIGERMTLGQSLLLERIEMMSEADRAAYADALEDAIKRRRPPRR